MTAVGVLWWNAMVLRRFSALRLVGGAVIGGALLVIGNPPAGAGIDSDDRGFVDSTARCGAPDVAVAFGRTESSRVAICKDPDGGYQYRGVRVSDGAKLIAPASLSGGVTYLATRDAITYSVSPGSLVVSSDGQVIRREPMLEFHQPGKPAPPAATPSPTPSAALPPPLAAEVGGG